MFLTDFGSDMNHRMARQLKPLCAIDPMQSGVTCFFIHSLPNLTDELITIGGLRMVSFPRGFSTHRLFDICLFFFGWSTDSDLSGDSHK